MVSASEQLMTTGNMSAFMKSGELRGRIFFTLLALIVYRFGVYVPLPGINASALRDTLENLGGIVQVFDLFSGGALSRMSVFALNIMPYISASIIMQLLTFMLPYLSQLRKDGDSSGRQKIIQYTRYLTVFIVIIQAYFLSVGLEGSKNVVLYPGMLFKFSIILTLTGGTLFLMWLGEQITSRGIGNGISLIIFSGIVASLPGAFFELFDLSRKGDISLFVVFALLVASVVIIALVVFVERGQRRLLVQYPKRQVGNKMYGGEGTHLPLKVNTAGVIPPIFASSILLLPFAFLNVLPAEGGNFQYILSFFERGAFGYLCAFAIFVIGLSFFYASIVFNPEETAESLKKNGGYIPGVRPGLNTANYLRYVLVRLTVVGSVYLAALSILPEILISKYSLPFYFGGTSLLIIVTVTLDTVSHIQSHLFAHQYESVLKKSKIKVRRK